MNFGYHQNLPQYPKFENSNWDFGKTVWTPAENKLFENALALHDKDTPDRWYKVAEMIPDKTVDDVRRQYRELEVDVGQIESGVTPLPGYVNCSFTVDWTNDDDIVGVKQVYGVNNAKRTISTMRGCEHERKKGIPWTQEEHVLFLKGLQKFGKGDWRSISRKIVKTRTPTQVASHAQKYFIRQESGAKDKRRSSIHDITIVNLTTNCHSPSSPLPDTVEPQQSDQFYFTAMQQQGQYQQPYLDALSRSHVDRNWHDQGPLMVYDPKIENCYGGEGINKLDPMMPRFKCTIKPQTAYEVQALADRGT